MNAEVADSSPTGAESANSARRPVLVVRDLQVVYRTRKGLVQAVRGVDLDIAPGEILGLIGESGCGKSATARAIMRMFVTPPSRLAGEVLFDGRDILKLRARDLDEIQGRHITMVSQDPASCLNPVFTVREQFDDVIKYSRVRHPTSGAERARMATDLLAQVGLHDAARVLSSYPHQLSGGMRQRVLLAMALVNQPRVLIADEPTTALDVTVQAQILSLTRRLAKAQGLAILFITHDLSVVAQICDRVAVMYAGRVVETAPVETIFALPRHPYTRALLALVADDSPAGRLVDISGAPPELIHVPSGCAFHPRCPMRETACLEHDPRLSYVEPEHRVACPPSLGGWRLADE
jgi:oligopeptide/dipeptide ABC transporter ATP-binding protein